MAACAPHRLPHSGIPECMIAQAFLHSKDPDSTGTHDWSALLVSRGAASLYCTACVHLFNSFIYLFAIPDPLYSSLGGAATLRVLHRLHGLHLLFPILRESFFSPILVSPGKKRSTSTQRARIHLCALLTYFNTGYHYVSRHISTHYRAVLHSQFPSSQFPRRRCHNGDAGAG